MLSFENCQVIYSEMPLTSGGYPIGTVAFYSCIYGFYPWPINSTTCHISGAWSHQLDHQLDPHCMQCNRATIPSPSNFSF